MRDLAFRWKTLGIIACVVTQRAPSGKTNVDEKRHRKAPIDQREVWPGFPGSADSSSLLGSFRHSHTARE
jgi:hypothetical protein